MRQNMIWIQSPHKLYGMKFQDIFKDNFWLSMLAACERGKCTTTTTTKIDQNHTDTIISGQSPQSDITHNNHTKPRTTKNWYLSGRFVTPWDHNLILSTHFPGCFFRTVVIFQDTFEFQDISRTFNDIQRQGWFSRTFQDAWGPCELQIMR